MLKLNVNEEKRLTFEVQIGGVNYDNVTSTFKIVLNEVEYGFPAKVGRETITVELPPLNKVIGAKISEGDEAEVRLELVADGHYLTPWQDNARLSNPLIVEAKIKDDSFKPNPSLKTKLVVSEDGARQKTIVKEQEINDEEDLTERIVSRLSEKFQTLLAKREQDEMPPMKDEGEDDDKENVEEKCSVKREEENEEEVEKDEKEVEESTAQALERLMNKALDAYDLTEGGDRKKSKKSMTLEEFKKNLTEEDVKRYIAAKGSKNQKVQEIIYEQAKLSAKKDTPAHVLKEVVKIIRKK